MNLASLKPGESGKITRVGTTGPLKRRLMDMGVLVGIPLYVCEGEEAPITYALMAHGLGPGPSLTFLLGSVGTCVPTVLMSRNIIGRRTTAFYLIFWFVFAIGSGVLFQTFLE